MLRNVAHRSQLSHTGNDSMVVVVEQWKRSKINKHRNIYHQSRMVYMHVTVRCSLMTKQRGGRSRKGEVMVGSPISTTVCVQGQWMSFYGQGSKQKKIKAKNKDKMSPDEV